MPKIIDPIAPSSTVLLLAALLAAGCASSSAGTSGTPAGSSSGAGTPAIGYSEDGYEVPALPAPSDISREEYAARRATLAQGLADGVFVAFGAPEPEMDYLPWGQDASFRYLTGIMEPNAGLIMVKAGGRVQEMLFVMERDPARELWEGSRLGTDGAQARTGIASRPIDEMRAVLDSAVARNPLLQIVTALPPTDTEALLTREQQIISGVVRRHPGSRVVSVSGQVERMRGTKSAAELDLIRRAVLISVLGHREAMRSATAAMNEFEVQGLMEYLFRRNGADGPAYSSIVGSGPNSTTLHYNANDRFMSGGELLLMDVGAGFRGYAADITRTLPLSGTFTADQRAIYDIVLRAQAAAESQLRPGATWTILEGAASGEISRGLTALGLIESPDATYDCASPATGNRCPQYRLYYMHGLGHGVGLQVHDPDVSYYGAFQRGAAVTLEPGVYVRGDVLDFLPDTPGNRAMIERLRPAVARYRDIGVRIEDVYLIGENGVERPSVGLPRNPDEVEALMREVGMGERDRRPEVVEWYRSTMPR
jgi:Xaa-Pro aminopeptidase